MNFFKKSRAFCLFALFSVAWVLFIFSNSLLGPEDSGAQSGMITAFLRKILDPNEKIPLETFHHFVRKAAHFTEFFILGFLFAGLTLCVRYRRGFWHNGLLLFAALAVAVTDEFIQSFTGRGPSVRDVVLDFSGALTGLLLVRLFLVPRNPKK
jgi:VanZ family protein